MRLQRTKLTKGLFIPCYEDDRRIVKDCTPRDFTSGVAFELYKEAYHIGEMRVIFKGWKFIPSNGEMATLISNGEHTLLFPFDNSKPITLNGEKVSCIRDLEFKGVELIKPSSTDE